MKLVKKYIFLILVAEILSLMVSCSYVFDVPNKSIPKIMLASSFGKSFTSQEIIDFKFANERLTKVERFIHSDIDVYDVAYKTLNGFGEKIVNSGIVLLPTSNIAIKGVISYQPGTVFLEEDRTTNYNNTETGTFNFFSFLAANGYIVFAADYAGFGLSKEEKHPYNIPDTLAVSAYDFIVAGYEFLEKKNIEKPSKLFLSGYSEGGLSNLALTRLIEDRKEFEVTAAACGAGAYDLNAFSQVLKFVITNELPLNEFVPLIFDSYNTFFFKRPTNAIFAEPYAGAIKNGLFDGEFNTQQILDNLPETYKELLNPEFTLGFVSSNDAVVENAIKENTYVGNGWIPVTPILFYQGLNDQAVLPLNTQNIVEYYTNNNKKDITLSTDDADHFEGRGSYNVVSLEYFNQF